MAARGIERGELISRGQRLLIAGLAWYRKKSGMAIIDRNGESYEVILVRDYSPTEESIAGGKHFFGSLKMSDYRGSLICPQ